MPPFTEISTNWVFGLSVFPKIRKVRLSLVRLTASPAAEVSYVSTALHTPGTASSDTCGEDKDRKKRRRKKEVFINKRILIGFFLRHNLSPILVDFPLKG